jgi:hypothetical protein
VTIKSGACSSLVKDKTWTVARVKAIVGDVIKVRDLARVVGPEIRKLTSDYQTGLGNSSITPLILGWHFNGFHVTPSFTVLLPGTYHRTSLASPSQNYFTFMPAVGLG